MLQSYSGYRPYLVFALIALIIAGNSGSGVAIADSGQTRSLLLYNTHTHEKTRIAFKRNGKYIRSGLKKLNNFLRDWRHNQPRNMDPKLFDLIWEVYRDVGATQPIHVLSGFRSLKTNNMLRRRSRRVAKNSQHIKGKAMDFFIPGVSLTRLRSVAMRKEIGGVGYYPRSNNRFVHLDTGSVRHWPRMPRYQLAKLFPKGVTQHIPSDGKPLSGYKLAKAKYERRKYMAKVKQDKKSSSGGWLAAIFGGNKPAVKPKTVRSDIVKNNKRAKNKTPLATRAVISATKGKQRDNRSTAIAAAKINPSLIITSRQAKEAVLKSMGRSADNSGLASVGAVTVRQQNASFNNTFLTSIRPAARPVTRLVTKLANTQTARPETSSNSSLLKDLQPPPPARLMAFADNTNKNPKPVSTEQRHAANNLLVKSMLRQNLTTNSKTINQEAINSTQIKQAINQDFDTVKQGYNTGKIKKMALSQVSHPSSYTSDKIRITASFGVIEKARENGNIVILR